MIFKHQVETYVRNIGEGFNNINKKYGTIKNLMTKLKTYISGEINGCNYTTKNNQIVTSIDNRIKWNKKQKNKLDSDVDQDVLVMARALSEGNQKLQKQLDEYQQASGSDNVSSGGTNTSSGTSGVTRYESKITDSIHVTATDNDVVQQLWYGKDNPIDVTVPKGCSINFDDYNNLMISGPGGNSTITAATNFPSKEMWEKYINNALQESAGTK